ncbi:hypothetical protein C8J56DRAFT_902487 [Mycena floridula]|nr:hypothetical protein C8J56DRAFT_902487 [Mycena floridula]
MSTRGMGEFWESVRFLWIRLSLVFCFCRFYWFRLVAVTDILGAKVLVPATQVDSAKWGSEESTLDSTSTSVATQAQGQLNIHGLHRNAPAPGFLPRATIGGTFVAQWVWERHGLLSPLLRMLPTRTKLRLRTQTRKQNNIMLNPSKGQSVASWTNGGFKWQEFGEDHQEKPKWVNNR